MTRRIAAALLLLSAILGINACGNGGAITSNGFSSTPGGGTGPSPIVIATASTLPDAVVNVKYTVTLSVSGGTSPYNFRVSSGSLPPNVTIDNTGTISGTPLAPTATPAAFTIQVTDSATSPQTVSQNFTLNVDAAPLPLTFVTAATLTAAVAGQSYAVVLNANGGTPPYAFSVTSGSTLPTGLSLAANGNTQAILSGTIGNAPAGGNFSFSLTVTDSASAPQTKAQTFTLPVVGALSGTTPALPVGIVGTAYSVALSATGGTAPYTFSLASGSTLPAGLSVVQGSIAGTPSSATTGAVSVTVQVTDSGSPALTATQTLNLTIVNPLVLAAANLPHAIVGTAYSATLNATGGTAPYTFSLASGSLPAGLTLGQGTISGTPTAATSGALTFTVKVTDSTSGQLTATQTFSLAALAPVAVSTATLPAGVVGTSYSTQLSATGGTAPYTFSLASGSSLPAGLSVVQGSITGTPLVVTTTPASFTIQVTDSSTPALTATGSLSLAIVKPLAGTTSSLSNGLVGLPYPATTLTASGGTAPYIFALASGSTLPAGLSLAANGTISGTPTTPTTNPVSITFQVTDSTSPKLTASQTFSISVFINLGISTSSVPNTVVGSAYTAPLTAMGGTQPYSFTLTSGSSLPAGLSLAANGTISGTSTQTGSSNFTVKVSDSSAPQLTATQNFGITVIPQLVVGNAPLPTAMINNSYVAGETVTGGVAPYNYSVSQGTPLPAGVVLASTGAAIQLSGTPTTPGSSPITIQVTDSGNPSQTVAQNYTLNVASSIVKAYPRNVNIPIRPTLDKVSGAPCPGNSGCAVGQHTQQFTAHIYGPAAGTTVNWDVNGIAGGNAAVGKIDATGLYTPPATLPVNPSLTIHAVNPAQTFVFDAVSVKLVAGVVVAPASTTLNINGTEQFSATVNGGVSDPSVKWFVNGVQGGNPTLGTISVGGLYTAPASVPPPGMVTITAQSNADPTEPGTASVTLLPAKTLKIYPTSATMLPGSNLAFQYYTTVYYPTNLISVNHFGPLVHWLVNGVEGGTALTGTITNGGVYTAPSSPATVTITVMSDFDATFLATATVTVTPPLTANSSVSVLDTWQKVRPYDVVTTAPEVASSLGSAPTGALNISAAQNEYASWQVVLTANGEDLTGSDVTVSDFTDGSGHTISAFPNSVIYLEKSLNVFYPSRAQGGGLGEWPDPLVPKVDQYFQQTRNAFPFAVNRVSPVYRMYNNLSGFANNISLGTGSVSISAPSGYTGNTLKLFVIKIVSGGALGTATFQWSNDGGVTFPNPAQATGPGPIPLSDGISVSFAAGTYAIPTATNVNGTALTTAGDVFWIWAGPQRNQPVWVDLYVPSGTPAGTYNGKVTVSSTGKTNTVMNVALQVYPFAIPTKPSIPAFFNGFWGSLIEGHLGVSSSPQDLVLGPLYEKACAANRISCSGNQHFPNFQFNANDSVTSSDFSGYDQGYLAFANGTGTFHGEPITSLEMPYSGSDATQIFNSTAATLNHYALTGERSSIFNYSKDEPAGNSDFLSLMDRASNVRSVDDTVRTLSTTCVNFDDYQTVGYLNRYVANWTFLNGVEFQRGPNGCARGFFDERVTAGDEFWWYTSCSELGCNGATDPTAFANIVKGTSPFLDNVPNYGLDTSALMNRIWGFLGEGPYRVQGVLYYDFSIAYQRGPFGPGTLNLTQTLPAIDVWDSIWEFGNNGDGDLFYPGRALCPITLAPCTSIGGQTDIPVESIRLKQIRSAMTDMEYGQLLKSQNNTALMQNTILTGGQDLHTYNPDPSVWRTIRQNLAGQIH